MSELMSDAEFDRWWLANTTISLDHSYALYARLAWLAARAPSGREPVAWRQFIGEKWAYFDGPTDPRTVHDNGKPCEPLYASPAGRKEPISAPSGAQQESSDDHNGTHSDRGQQGVPSESVRATTRAVSSGCEAGNIHDGTDSRRGENRSEGNRRFPLAFDNEWLRKRIASDPDDEPSAGDLAGREEPK